MSLEKINVSTDIDIPSESDFYINTPSETREGDDISGKFNSLIDRTSETTMRLQEQMEQSLVDITTERFTQMIDSSRTIEFTKILDTYLV